MKKKRIILTGDDGYNSVGTRILIHFLKNDFDLTIAATKNQQSGVGGLVHIKDGGKWGEDVIDGVHAYWFDGSPVDALDCMSGLFNDSFDYCISGINYGPNVGMNVISSGTFAAAFYSLGVGVAEHAMAISWDTPKELFLKNHDHHEDISSYLSYPGESAMKIIHEAIKHNWWGVPLLNVNLPRQKTSKICTTVMRTNVRGYWEKSIMDTETKRFSFPMGRPENVRKTHDTDADAVDNGYISITAMNPDMTHGAANKNIDTSSLL